LQHILLTAKDFAVPAFSRTIAAMLPCDCLLTLFSSGFGPGQSGGFGQQPGFGAGGGVNPYSNPPGVGAPPPKKSNTWIWILGIVGVLGLGMVICCGVGGYFVYSAGVNMMAEMVKQEVADDPQVQEHIGEISSMPLNLIKSTEETEKRGTGDNILVFEAKGTKGNGEFIVHQPKQPQPGEVFKKIDLRLPGGEEISIR
jgi:hypothetical protein